MSAIPTELSAIYHTDSTPTANQMEFGHLVVSCTKGTIRTCSIRKVQQTSQSLSTWNHCTSPFFPIPFSIIPCDVWHLNLRGLVSLQLNLSQIFLVFFQCKDSGFKEPSGFFWISTRDIHLLLQALLLHIFSLLSF